MCMYRARHRMKITYQYVRIHIHIGQAIYIQMYIHTLTWIYALRMIPPGCSILQGDHYVCVCVCVHMLVCMYVHDVYRASILVCMFAYVCVYEYTYANTCI